jgi:hypothetical protein
VYTLNIERCDFDISLTQEFGGTLIGEDRLVVMTGADSVEWIQIHPTHWFPGV